MGANNDVIIKLVENKITISIYSKSLLTSTHIWRISDVNGKNKERIFMSGWTEVKQLSEQIFEPGIYYAEIIMKDTGNHVLSEKIDVSFNDIINNNYDEVALSLGRKRIESNFYSELMQKMFIAGSKYITLELNKHLGTSQLNLFAENEDTMRIMNTIYSQDFFDGNITVNKFLGLDRAYIGYQVSTSFRAVYVSIQSEFKNLTDKDVVLYIPSINSKTKIVLEELKKRHIRTLNLVDIVQKAIENKVLLDPLAQLSSAGIQVIYLNFPRAYDVKNKTENEEVASKTTIGNIRQLKKDKIYPLALKKVSDDQEYFDEVTDGWTLTPQKGSFDFLQDKTGKFVNIKGGHRVIPDYLNSSDSKTMYFFGNSVMYGIGTDDENTLPSLIAKEIKSRLKNLYHIKNMANFSMNDYVRGTNLIKSINFNNSDIVVFGAHLPLSKYQQQMIGGVYIDMQPYFDRPNGLDEVFLDMTHLNAIGYKFMADIFLDVVESNGILKGRTND